MDDKTYKRFISKIHIDEETGCWEWQGFKNIDGYGIFGVHWKRYRAHRIMFEHTHGSIPAGLILRHTCDNPSCVNPEHLIPGTKADNSRDMIERGRDYHPAGSGASKAILSESDVLTIRELYATGQFTQQQIADFYNIAATTISDINTRKSWKHI